MNTLSPIDVVAIGTEIAIMLAKDKSIEELNVIRNVASQIAASISTISSQLLLIKAENAPKTQ